MQRSDIDANGAGRVRGGAPGRGALQLWQGLSSRRRFGSPDTGRGCAPALRPRAYGCVDDSALMLLAALAAGCARQRWRGGGSCAAEAWLGGSVSAWPAEAAWSQLQPRGGQSRSWKGRCWRTTRRPREADARARRGGVEAVVGRTGCRAGAVRAAASRWPPGRHGRRARGVGLYSVNTRRPRWRRRAAAWVGGVGRRTAVPLRLRARARRRYRASNCTTRLVRFL